jgi:1,4-alpha-glucan branching enzyme
MATITEAQTGMGAVSHGSGTTFYVWAPFACSVSVAGDFNDWSDTSHPLMEASGGYWSCKVPEAMPGQRYKLVIRNPSLDNPLWRVDPYARKVIRRDSDGVASAVIHNPDFNWDGDRFQMPPWNELIIYELHVGTYNDLPGGMPGHLGKVIEELPYLKELGINAIELMPLVEFNDVWSWGYNPSNPFAVEDAYGDPRDLKSLVKRAHQLGMAVILDVVFNHFGPDQLDMWQFDGWSQFGKGGIYFYNDWRSTTPWGETRPDFGRGEVRRFIRDNALFWLNEYHMDGLRFDSVVNIRNAHGDGNNPGADIPEGWSLLQWLNNEISARQPRKIRIAEDLQRNDWVTKPTDQDGAGFNSQWDSVFVHAIRNAVITTWDIDRNMYQIRDAICHRHNGDAFQRVIYIESHDEAAEGNHGRRLTDAIKPGDAEGYHAQKRATVAAALLLTSPGIPMLFQGQEVLDYEAFHDQRPIRWYERMQAHSGIQKMYRDLIRLRRNWFNTTAGLRGQHVNVFHVNNADKVIAFHRWENGGLGDDVIIVVNFADCTYGSYTIGLPRFGEWKVRFNSDWRGYSPLFRNQPGYDTAAHHGGCDGLPFRGNIGIGPYACLILSQG